MRIEITDEMREAISRMRARDAEARDTQRTEGERRLSMVYRGWAASDLARLVDEAVEADDDRDEDEALQAHAAETLRWLMRDISEEQMCSGWLTGLEYDLWRMVTTGRRWYGLGYIPEERVQLLRLLSQTARGWWVWSEDAKRERFVSMSEWLRMYSDREEISKIALSPGPCFNDDCERGSIEGSPFCAECEPPPCGAMRTPADITACNRPRGHDGPHRGEAQGEHTGRVEWDKREEARGG